jgi:tripartite-type tricarboxylate transporter receptor subunit TctC
MKRAIKVGLVRPRTCRQESSTAGLAHPKIKARLADLGATPLAGSPADFAQLIADETEKWGKVIKFAGIKAQ